MQETLDSRLYVVFLRSRTHSMCHLRPFQTTLYVLLCPPTSTFPTATHMRALAHDTAPSPLKLSFGGSGTGVIFHALPFQICA